MKFSIGSQEENGLSIIRLSNNEEQSMVGILPDFGALLHEFCFLKEGNSFNCIDNYRNRAELDEQLPVSYKSAKLSPFPCRIDNGKYRFHDHNYTFTHISADGSAIHGLLFNRPFTVTEQSTSDKNACITLKYDYPGDEPGYPFPYSCTVTYILETDNTLQVRTVLHNTSADPIPIADGWHPYFTLGGSFDEYSIRFPASRMIAFNERLVPTGKFEEDGRYKKGTLLKGIELNNCFVMEKHDDEPVCVLSNPKEKTSLLIYAGDNYPYLQLYIPPERTSIAIENLSGAPDCFNNGMGLLVLPPGKSETFILRYCIEHNK